MVKRTRKSLLIEFEDIRRRIPDLIKKGKETKHSEGIKLSREVLKNHTSLYWVYYAHEGSLQKIQGLLSRDGDYETFELLAIARNIFENLVWLRLMTIDINFGLVFYAHLLRGQRENCEKFITKITEEASLFDLANELDRTICDEVVKIIPAPSSSEAARNNWKEEINKRITTLDDMVRREFSLYAYQATHNGYSYQSHFIRSKEIPRFQVQLNQILVFETELTTALPTLLNQRLKCIALNKWNWLDRSKEASMEKQYQFIYGFTSRLLHSTPVNIVTDKVLAEEEMLLVLDYIVISSLDMMDIIENFSSSRVLGICNMPP